MTFKVTEVTIGFGGFPLFFERSHSESKRIILMKETKAGGRFRVARDFVEGSISRRNTLSSDSQSVYPPENSYVLVTTFF